jgi:hypothetical protein
LDEQKLTMLRRWGEGLSRDDREEVRAAGRAILMLSDEVERLHVDLWHARDRSDAAPDPSLSPGGEEWPRSAGEDTLGRALRDRLSVFRLSKNE